MRNALRFLYYWGVLISFWATPLHANNSCSLSLENIFQEQYYSTEGYECSFCFFNAGELARTIKTRLGQEVDEKDLTIIVVKHKDVSNPVMDEELFQIQYGIVGMQPRKGQTSDNGRTYAVWKYHAVLEHKGKILDLDIKEGKGPLPIRQYFDEMFHAIESNFTKYTRYHPEDNIPTMRKYNQWHTIEVFKIPIIDYFRQFSEKPLKGESKGEKLKFIWKYPSINLWDYLRANEPIPKQEPSKPNLLRRLFHLNF